MNTTDPRDLKLNPDTWDLEIENGDLVLISGSEGVAQEVKFGLQMWRGEYFADLNAGIRWQEILGEKYDETFIRQQLTDYIVSVPQVAELVSLVLDFNNTARELTITFRIRTEFGDTVDGEVTNYV